MMITVAPELNASLRVARAVLASRAGPGAGRSALVVALLVSVAPGVIARQQAATSQASEEVALISTGWAYLAAGDLARAVDHANLALAKSPRSLAAITPRGRPSIGCWRTGRRRSEFKRPVCSPNGLPATSRR
jgi:hypothetical protein